MPRAAASQSLSGAWQFRQIGTDEWSPAQVPGEVHLDLMAQGRIPDPFVGDQELRVQWVAQSDWEYQRTFQLAPELSDLASIDLVCDGLDTLADVYLNDRLVGRGNNMFRRYRWEVKSLLHEGENEIRIRFASPVKYAQARQAVQPLICPIQSIPGGPHLRKASYQWGWDWAPQLPAIGIWKDLRLEATSTVRLEEVHLRQRHQVGEVTLSARIHIAGREVAGARVEVRVMPPAGPVLVAQGVFPPGRPETLVEMAIPQPRLWWPNGYGDQPLYRVEVVLFAGEQALDQKTYQVGLRTVELVQKPDEAGVSFTFVVNGVPIFAKGANWIPADSFPARIRNAQLEHLFWSAAEAHMNMLRVWGGGFYEEERFYDLADRYGILVWQDFPFSCSTYPDDPDFLANVRDEAVQNVRRLRHRASLALWCGNNEMEMGWVHWGWDLPANQRYKEAYERLFHHLLPEICALEDPDHAYWPSSPSSNTLFLAPNSNERGDAHYWEVWHGRQPFAAYREQFPRFMSEFGFQSLPPLETIQTYADPSEWNITSYVMEHHQKNASGNELMVSQMLAQYRLPNNFPALVYLSMVLQGDGIRYGVEHWRRNRDRVSGTLFWQLNDCWPVASWASIDYFGRWKALHYMARRFYAPVLLSAEDQGPRVGLHLTNDTLETWQGRVHWSLETLAGDALSEGAFAVSAPGQSSAPVTVVDALGMISEANRRKLILVYELWQGEQRLSLGIVSFVPSKYLELVDPELQVVCRLAGEQMEVELSAKSLARFVCLELPGADVVFSDNYFDLPAGRQMQVRFPLPHGWTPERAQREIRVKSLFDSNR